jgi:hypothetical protein
MRYPVTFEVKKKSQDIFCFKGDFLVDLNLTVRLRCK